MTSPHVVFQEDQDQEEAEQYLYDIDIDYIDFFFFFSITHTDEAKKANSINLSWISKNLN